MKSTPQAVADFEVPAGLLDDDFLKDLDVAFDAIEMADPSQKSKNKKTKTAAKAKGKQNGLNDMHITFLAVTRVHLQPTLRYLKAIEIGVSTKDLCEIVHYVVGPLVMKAKKVGLAQHTKALIAFQRTLKKAVASSGSQLTHAQRVALSDSFAVVEELFQLDFRGHSTAVVNLLGYFKKLKRTKSVTDMEMKKLFSIGLPSISMIRKSSIEELSSLSGIAPERMSELRKIARNFSIYDLI